jgi:diamine N-acetyltransferase
MDDLKLVTASEKDTVKIARLAQEIWRRYYPDIIGQAQVDYMLELMYSQKSLIEQMTVQGHQFYFINVDDEHIGFISMNKVNDNNWSLNKFYIHHNVSGVGVGTASFHALIELIKPKKITLTVNRKNYKSVNFYFKNGFVIKRVENFDIGNGFEMNDFVMEWNFDLRM